jgi:hypothetical protein
VVSGCTRQSGLPRRRRQMPGHATAVATTRAHACQHGLAWLSWNVALAGPPDYPCAGLPRAVQGCFFFRVVGTLEPAVRTGPAGASAVNGDTANPPETGWASRAPGRHAGSGPTPARSSGGSFLEPPYPPPPRSFIQGSAVYSDGFKVWRLAAPGGVSGSGRETLGGGGRGFRVGSGNARRQAHKAGVAAWTGANSSLLARTFIAPAS